MARAGRKLSTFVASTMPKWPRQVRGLSRTVNFLRFSLNISMRLRMLCSCLACLL